MAWFSAPRSERHRSARSSYTQTWLPAFGLVRGGRYSLQRVVWMLNRKYTNITIAAIDTSSFEKPEFAEKMEFMCSVPELCQYLGHEETRRYIDFNCNEEYLVLNQLRCKIAHIPFNDLYNGGIRFMLPGGPEGTSTYRWRTCGVEKDHLQPSVLHPASTQSEHYRLWGTLRHEYTLVKDLWS